MSEIRYSNIDDIGKYLRFIENEAPSCDRELLASAHVLLRFSQEGFAIYGQKSYVEYHQKEQSIYLGGIGVIEKRKARGK